MCSHFHSQDTHAQQRRNFVSLQKDSGVTHPSEEVQLSIWVALLGAELTLQGPICPRSPDSTGLVSCQARQPHMTHRPCTCAAAAGLPRCRWPAAQEAAISHTAALLLSSTAEIGRAIIVVQAEPIGIKVAGTVARCVFTTCTC